MILLNLKKCLMSFGLVLLCVGLFTAQTAEVTVNLTEILQNANLQTQKYDAEFKNLLAAETKTFETFDREGNVKKRTVIESNFIVLQSEKNTNGSVTAEYRSVTKVDGKEVGDVEKRNADLFEQIAKAKSVKEELERIQKESSRYDKNIEISGFTLLQAPVLDDVLRPFFEFSMLDREVIGGREVFVVSYRQTKQSPNILINQKNFNNQGLILSFEADLPDSFKKSDVFLRGKLWIDAETFQIWREERELTAAKDSNNFVLQRSDFEYQPSDFGILVPKQISLVQNKVKKTDGKFTETKNLKVSFTYSRFRKSNVDVQILDDEN